MGPKSLYLIHPVIPGIRQDGDPKDMEAYEGMVALALTGSAQEGRARRGR